MFSSLPSRIARGGGGGWTNFGCKVSRYLFASRSSRPSSTRLPSLGETELTLRDGISQVDVSFFSSKHTEYSSRERISINFFSFFRRVSYRGSSFEYTLVSFFSLLLRFVFEKLQIARRESHLRYELLFQRDEALISRVGREREMPLPDYFSIGRGMGEGGRKRKEKKLTLIPSPPCLYSRKSGTTRLRRAISVSCSQQRCSRSERIISEPLFLSPPSLSLPLFSSDAFSF